MSSIRELNTPSSPYWDFINQIQRLSRGNQHPFAPAFASDETLRNVDENMGGGSEYPHPPPGDGPDGPPPPPPVPSGPDDQPMPPPPPPGQDLPHRHRGPHPHHHHPHHHRGPRGGFGGHRGREGFGGRGGCRSFGGRRGPWEGMFGGREPPFDADRLAQFFGSALFGGAPDAAAGGEDAADFTPEADVFDGETSFVIHLSLPGAKKEDIAVNWDAEKSELQISGVVYRPGNEDFLKTLALDERKVGAFERKVKLGSTTAPAQVNDDMITAKLEDGILRINVPKTEKDFVEVRRIDVL